MTDSVNLGPVQTGAEANQANPAAYFNNLSLPPLNVSQDVGDAVQSFFEKITENKDSAAILASAIIYTSAAQGVNPMSTIYEFQKLPPGQLNEYLSTFLNLNRVGTSLLAVPNTPTSGTLIRRTVLV